MDGSKSYTHKSTKAYPTRYCLNCRDPFQPWKITQNFCVDQCRYDLQKRERDSLQSFMVAMSAQGFKCAGCGEAPGMLTAQVIPLHGITAPNTPRAVSLPKLVPLVLWPASPVSEIVAVCPSCKRRYSGTVVCEAIDEIAMGKGRDILSLENAVDLSH